MAKKIPSVEHFNASPFSSTLGYSQSMYQRDCCGDWVTVPGSSLLPMHLNCIAMPFVTGLHGASRAECVCLVDVGLGRFTYFG